MSNKYASGHSHSFDTGIAQSCGLSAAAVYNHLAYWIKHNKVNGKNEREGKTWVYYTYEKISQYLPYLSPSQVKRAIEKLIENGVVMKGEFNEDKFCRVSWYAIPDIENEDPEIPKKEEKPKNSKNVTDQTNSSDRENDFVPSLNIYSKPKVYVEKPKDPADIKKATSDSAHTRKGEIAENRKSSLLNLEISSALEFCEQTGIKIKQRDFEIWSKKYTSDEIFAALRLILEDEGLITGINPKTPIDNHAAFVNKALGGKWTKERKNMEVNKQFAEEVKSKGWKALVITKQYCRCSSTGNDWSFKLSPEVFRREIEAYIEKQKQAYEARRNKSYE